MKAALGGPAALAVTALAVAALSVAALSVAAVAAAAQWRATGNTSSWKKHL
jgi:hypothetical protein